jgi:hypothetical protein
MPGAANPIAGRLLQCGYMFYPFLLEIEDISRALRQTPN